MDTRHMPFDAVCTYIAVALRYGSQDQRGAQFFFDIGELELGNGADKIEKGSNC